MDKNQAKREILKRIDSPEVTKKVLKTFFRLPLDKPRGLDWDQEVLFTFLHRWALASATLYRVFFPEPINELWGGTRSASDAKPVPDVYAAAVLIRSLYEDYLLAFSLIDQGTKTSVRRCRYLAWIRQGKFTTMKSAEHFGASLRGRQFTTDAFNKADGDFQKHQESARQDKTTQKALIQHGRAGSWIKLAKDAHVDMNYHQSVYKILCGYAHSDASSFEQVVGGSWTRLFTVFRGLYIQIAALMLDLTRQHLFRAQIDGDIVLEVVREYGVEYLRNFSKV